MYKPEAVDLLMSLIPRQIPVDEKYYLDQNLDVKNAVENGTLRSAAEHYIEHGFYEDRLPQDIVIDEEDYLQRYPDVGEAIRLGNVEGATAHWMSFGRFEGRTAILCSRHLKGKQRR